MDVQTAIALASTSVAAIIAIAVPWVSFRLTLRVDHKRWLREQRAQFYVDLLTEAYAEQQWLEQDVADDDTRDRLRSHFSDLRLPSLERARLGARGTMFGSRAVNALFNRLQAEMFWSAPSGRPDEGERMTVRMRVGRLHDELQAVIRKEMGANHVLPTVDSRLLDEPHPAQRAAQEFESTLGAWPSETDESRP